MKLAEALIQRADAQKHLEQLRQRIMRSAKVQEGEIPPEEPQELLSEANSVIDELTRLIQQINRTNSSTAFDENRSLADALAERDMLMTRRSIFSSLANEASQSQMRYGRSEIKIVTTVKVGELQKEVDSLSRQYRELDTAIQQLNWTVDLIED